MSLRRACLSSSALLSILVFGCGSPPPVQPDGGTDGGEPDAGPPFACAQTRPLAGVLGETVTMMLDTTMTTSRPRDLGLSCGNTEGAVRWARQEVIELSVPGTGPVAIDVDATGPGTPIDFNTVIQVRRDCAVAPEGVFPPTCFDDVTTDEIRSRGAFTAMGGETVYLYVTGYSDPPAEQVAVDEGPIQIDISMRANNAPTLTAGFMRLAEDDVLVGVTATDDDADLAGIAMNFLGPDGELLDIFGDGSATLEGDALVLNFQPAPSGTSYDDYTVIRAVDIGLGAYLRAVGATAAILRVFDTGNASSAQLNVTITEANLVGFEDACDAMNACRSPMQCELGICQVFGPARTVCDSAIELAIETPTTVATSVRRSGTTGAGLGQYVPSCVDNPNGPIGAERVYAVTVPAGMFDLLVTTNLPGSGTTDTILYVRSTCPDSGTELACNDDIGADPHSAVEIRDIAAGRYSIFVERFGGLGSGSIPHELEVTLRPVLATGAACDDTGVTNRCAAGPCAASVCP